MFSVSMCRYVEILNLCEYVVVCLPLNSAPVFCVPLFFAFTYGSYHLILCNQAIRHGVTCCWKQPYTTLRPQSPWKSSSFVFHVSACDSRRWNQCSSSITSILNLQMLSYVAQSLPDLVAEEVCDLIHEIPFRNSYDIFQDATHWIIRSRTPRCTFHKC